MSDVTDFPDFGAYSQWRSKNIFTAGSQTLAPGYHDGTVTAMQSWQSLMVRVAPTAGYGTVTVNWFADSAAADLTGSDQWIVNATTGLFVIMPCEGMYARIDIHVTSATDMTTTSYAFGANNTAGGIYYPVTGQEISESGITLAASAHATYTRPFIIRGQHFLNFSPYDSAGKLHCQVFKLNADSTYSETLVDIGTPTAPFTGMVSVPDRPAVVVITNEDASSSHTFNVAFTPTYGT